MSHIQPVQVYTDGIDALRKYASKEEFAGKDFNSLKSIIIQIDQNNLLNEEQRNDLMLNIMVAVNENLGVIL